MSASNPRDVAYLCRDFTRSIHQKAVTSDPNYLKLSVMCGRIEQWTEHHYPSIMEITRVGGSAKVEINPDPKDARLRIFKREARIHTISGGKGITANGHTVAGSAAKNGQEPLPKELMYVVGGGMILTGLLGLAVVYIVIFFTGALDA